MADRSAIEWTDATWNPTVGCSIVSKGCTNCYAMKMAARFAAMRQPIYQGLTQPSKAGPVWTGKVDLSNWGQVIKPLSWRRPRRIFVNSMSDLFHEALPDDAIDQVFAVMALCPQHTFQILTKRPERMRDYIRVRAGDWQVVLPDAHAPGTLPITKNDVERALGRAAKFSYDPPTPTWPLPNVWLGVSVEDQATADARIPVLLDTPAALRFISAEPLLGPVDLPGAGGITWNSGGTYDDGGRPAEEAPSVVRCRSIDWVIAGGESGPGARPAHPDWFRALRDQCAAASVPFFFKQWGAWTPGENVERMTGVVETAHWFNDRWRFERENLACEDGHIDDQPNLYRIGKRAAGAMLDGRAHREFPRCS